MNIQDIRSKYPEYDDMSDKALTEALHSTFYSDMSFEEFSSKVGFTDTEEVTTGKIEDTSIRPEQVTRLEEPQAAQMQRLQDQQTFVTEAEANLQQEISRELQDTSVSSNAVDFIASAEGFKDTAYLPTKDDVPTIGFGRTENVKMNDTTSFEEEKKYLEEQINSTENKLKKELGNVWDTLTDSQKTAIISLAYNVDKDIVGQLKRSKAFKALKSGDLETFKFEAFDPKQGFVKQKGKILKGLVNRRQKELQLFENRVAQND